MTENSLGVRVTPLRVLWCYIWSRAEKGAGSRWGAESFRLGRPPPAASATVAELSRGHTCLREGHGCRERLGANSQLIYGRQC